MSCITNILNSSLCIIIMRWLSCVSAILMASAVAEAQQCGGGSGAVAGGVGVGATRLWLSGEHNATGHWTATLRLEKDSAVGRPGRQRLQLQLEPSSWRCGSTRTDALQLTLHSPPLPPGPDYQQLAGGHFYKLHTELLSWEAAKRACEAEGAFLLVLNSQKEADAILQLMKEYKGLSEWLHIGFHDKDREGHYFTVLGDLLSQSGYTRWEQRDPTGDPEDCGAISKTVGLVDITCENHKMNFICEQFS